MRYFYVKTIALLISLVTLSKGIQWFTREPPSVLYMYSGGTARLVWDYNVRNRTAMFDPYSPEWTRYNTSGFRIGTIGVEDDYNGWKFIINNKCPPNLRVRVSKESTATLVISNVTEADNGIYECSLLLMAGSPMRSKVQLVVTTKPRFKTDPFLSTKIVNEYQDFVISCTAIGIPTPNVTWVKLQSVSKKIIGQGLGQALLYIPNITRTESGLYRCLAVNNPNEHPELREITVVVWYKPTILSLTNSTDHDTLSTEKRLTLHCLVDGLPTPLIKWYDPKGMQITKGVRNITGGSILTLVTYSSDKCKKARKTSDLYCTRNLRFHLGFYGKNLALRTK